MLNRPTFCRLRLALSRLQSAQGLFQCISRIWTALYPATTPLLRLIAK